MIIGENIKYFNLGSIRFKPIEFDVPKSIDTNTNIQQTYIFCGDNCINLYLIFPKMTPNIDAHLSSNVILKNQIL